MQNPNAIECISVYAVEIPFRALGMRDLCTELGIPMCVQCAGGSGITPAEILHRAHSLAPERLLYVGDTGDQVRMPTVPNPVPRRHGRMHAHGLPGLGVEPLAEIPGEAVAAYG